MDMAYPLIWRIQKVDMAYPWIWRIQKVDMAYPNLLKKILEYFIRGSYANQSRYAVLSSNTPLKMDNPNITMKEYIRLQEEKALTRGERFNWQTATYCKMEYCEDEDDCFTNFESAFLAIVLDNTITPREALSWEPTVSPLNDNEIDFRISFDESDDEDYTVVYDENLFSYKIISGNNLKTDSENDNDKVSIPSFPSPEPEVSYFNDLDFFKDFENEFPAIVYNDALTSKLDLLTEPTISRRHIDEFDLKDETSLSECDEEEQNILYFNDLFPFNVIYPDDLKSDMGNNNDKIDIEQPLGDMCHTSKTAADAKIAIQEMAEYSQKWHNGTSSRTRSTKTSDGLAAIQAQLNNLGREINKVNEKVYVAQVGCAKCKGTTQYQKIVHKGRRWKT
ncbi:hypothetical protein Tco_0072386 [Tanacetum coccineum]